jgi:2,3-bisphosphoglycerate-independent phosphoglycerate mutase
LGKSPDPKVSAIDNANIPFIKVFIKLPKCPTSQDGLNVVYQRDKWEIAKWTHESWCRTHRLSGCQDKSGCNKTLAEEQVLKDAFQYALDNNKKVHF